jgi:hypothetical protein
MKANAKESYATMNSTGVSTPSVLDGIAFFHNAFPGKIQLSAVLLR